MGVSPLHHWHRYQVFGAVALVVGTMLFLAERHLSQADAQEHSGFVGGLEDNGERLAHRPVRNDVAQPGDEIVTLRYFRIQKGTFPEFYEASERGVWPYFEKIGARVVGMWQIIHPPEDTSEGSPDYDEVYLMTRYASVAHWEATRAATAHGGDGPDWDTCLEALRYRRSVTLETRVRFLKGHKWDNAPWFMPGLDEDYAPVN